MGKLYYDAHAKNVIVKCKDGQDLETLIENGEIGGGNKNPDPSKMIQIMILSTVPNLDTVADEVYVYTKIGQIDMDVEGNTITFYAYFRNIEPDDNIPVGIVVIASYYNLATVSTLGGTWEYLGRMVVEIDSEDKTFYLYEKKA